MGNFLAIAGFEVATRMRRLSTWVYFLVFGALAMLWTAAAGGAFANAAVVFDSSKVWINSPYAIQQTIAFLGLAALTVIAAIAGRAVQQDFEYRTESFFFTAPITKWQYLGGRFAGAIVVMLVVLSSLALGAFLGTFLPGIDADRLGPRRALPYVLPYLTMLLPNLLWLGGVFFCVAALSRRMLPVYLGSVLALIGYLIARSLLRDVDNKTLASLVDPFGVTAAAVLTRYWTIADRNSALVPLDGVLAANRALWIGIGAAIMAFCYGRFRFAWPVSGARAPRAADAAAEPPLAPFRATSPVPGRLRAIGLLPRMTWLYFRETVKNLYFAVFALAGIAFLVFASTTLGSIFGTSTWPVTYQMTGLVGGSFGVFMIVIITFYAGELVWRERDNRLDQIHDALPIPTWLPFLAKLFALMLVPVVLQAVLMLCGMAIQTVEGYHHYEPLLYLHELFGIGLVQYWLVCVLAITVQSLVNHKYLGHFLMIVYFLALTFAVPLGFEHNLYLYGNEAEYTYSDMNGYGHFLPRIRAFDAYYAGWALLLAVVAYLAWTRGTPASLRGRLARARARLTPRVAMLACAGALATAALGGFIFYNTNVLNRYLTTHDQLARQADYEKKYRAQAGTPQPKVTAVRAAVDLYPREQRVRMRATLGLVNRNAAPVDTILLGWGQIEGLDVHTVDFGVPATLETDDPSIGVRRYRLATPMAPGTTLTMHVDTEVSTHGFRNRGSNTAVVYNGSFVNGLFALPVIGYDERAELVSDRDRKKFGLAPKERMRDRDDPAGLARNGLTPYADWVSFEAEVSTDADQRAIAPGYLEREWEDGGRRHFLYRMDVPILDFFAVQSGRYAVRKDRWHDVALEVWYQPGHEYNIERMLDAAKASLDYYSTHFGPYQYRQFRIIEFPRYATFAQSFPNTVPFSEGIGFIARVRDDAKDDIDYPYYVTAHEVAHQWWAHQVIGGDVQGLAMLSETFAQYSALMVMKKKYGAAKMQRFLAYELDRYLIGRATEQKKEQPLARVENQDYIHYRKGSLVMYALADYIGEDNVDRALRRFRDDHAFKGPPYPNTTEFLRDLRDVTPARYQYLIDDMFESIILYDNRAVSATAKALPGGHYAVTLEVAARKRKADGLGKEEDAPLHDWIDVGVLDADGKPLYLEKKAFDADKATFTIEVAAKPARAGIDPMNELIDRTPRDNTIAVTIE
jgi:ABC-type transport system involved in multi-copper enzyme maturation permease subunit